jgi:hypothetical protein
MPQELSLHKNGMDKAGVRGILLLAAGLILAGCVGDRPADDRNIGGRGEAIAVFLGEMTPFYRGHPVLGELLSGGGVQPGGDICKVPGYLLDPSLDFPYRRKDSPVELMYTDFITAVRFLGGISDHRIPLKTERGGALDLAVREADGEIRYEWGPLDRFDRYVQLFREEITIVLDSVPTAFVAEPKWTSYGQFRPPDRYDEWTDFMQALCRELVRRYGFETVNCWRFRILTEGRLDVNTEQFLAHYLHTTSAIRAILPDVEFQAYNVAAVHVPELHHIHYYNFVKRLAEENTENPDRGICLISSQPVSYYSVPLTADVAREHPLAVAGDLETGLSEWTVSPVIRARTEYKSFWDEVDRLMDAALPREIQELGILRTETGIKTSEPGARGAAWLHQFLFTMWQDAALDRAWHWHTTDVLSIPDKPVSEQNRLLRSNGWLYQILDHMEGAMVYNLPIEVGLSGEGGLTARSDLFLRANNGDSFLLASGFHIRRDFQEEVPFSIIIPCQIAPRISALKGYAVLNPETDVYRMIRDDLNTHGELEDNFRLDPFLFSTVSGEGQPTDGMATREGVGRMDRDFEIYAQQIQKSLTLHDFPGSIEREPNGDLRIKGTFNIPETFVLVWTGE